MSKLGGKKAREAKENAKRPPAVVPPSAPQFSLCAACMYPNHGTAPKCERCGADGARVPVQKHKGLTIEELRRMGASFDYTASRTTAFTERWVISFIMYTARIEDEQHEASEEYRAMFWIRLQGVITELPRYLESSAIISEEDAAGTPLARYAAAVKAATGAVDAITKAITRDQHIYAEWRRHTECHLRQGAFQVQANGKVNGVRSIKTDTTLRSMAVQGQGKESVEELNAALVRILVAHEHDDLAIARTIARQIREPAEKLREAWKDFPP